MEDLGLYPFIDLDQYGKVPVDRHHVVFRSQGGKDSDATGTSRELHTDIHEHGVKYDPAARDLTNLW